MPCTEECVQTLAVICVILVLLLIFNVFRHRRCNRSCCRKRADPMSASQQLYQEVKEKYHPGLTEVELAAGSQDLAFDPETTAIDEPQLLF